MRSAAPSTGRALLALAGLPRGERRRLVLSVALSAGAMAAAIGLLGTSGYLISRAAQRPPILMLMVAIVAVRAFGVTRAVLRYGERICSHDLAFRQLSRLRVRFFERLTPLVPGQLAGHGSGDLLARFVADVDTLQDLYLRTVIPSIVALAVISGAALAAWVMLPGAGAAVLASLAVAAITLPWLSDAIAASSSRRQAHVRARLVGQLVESIDGAPELAIAGRATERVRQLASTDAQLARLGRRDAVSAALATGLGSALTGAGLLAVLFVAIPAVHSGALSGVLLAALAFLFLAAYESVVPLPAAARRLRACAAAAGRLQDVCGAQATVLDPPGPRALSGRGALALDGVRARYGPQEPWVLDGVDLRLEPAERIMLCGPSGTGKSTLAELLVRFRDPDAGRVSLDGIDVHELTQEDLRRAVLLCDQDAHLFNTTVRENLLIARRDASDGELIDALRAVELADWVTGLPAGLDTFVGHDGELLSGGQRQRVALARALLCDARFLILDEPTAHLDARLAERVIGQVLRAAGARAVLVITHDLTGCEGFDRVLCLQQGELIPLTEPGFTFTGELTGACA